MRPTFLDRSWPNDSEKLVRSQTNSQILRNLNLCHQFFLLFDYHVETQFPLPLYYSRPGPSVVAATRFLYRDLSLQSGLTLPLANPPIERGLLSNLFFAFSRSRVLLEVSRSWFRARSLGTHPWTRDI